MNETEQGRSMVEMLGVLAVIGMLSIMGIAAYTIAMNRYRANEILTEARKRAIVVAARIVAGDKGEEEGNGVHYFPLSEFGNEPIFGASFSDVAYHVNKQIQIDVFDLVPEICRHMQAIAGTESGVQIEADCQEQEATFVFNEDMGMGEVNSIDVGVCHNGNVYLSYNSNPCGTETNVTGCQKNSDCTNAKDESNHDCGEHGCYCNLYASKDTLSVPDIGVCKAIGGSTSYHYNDIDFVQSKAFLQYWAAENWCKAQNKKMISLADLGIDTSTLGDYYHAHKYCYSNTCPTVDWNGLMSVFGYSGFWTSNRISLKEVNTMNFSASGNSCICHATATILKNVLCR